MQWFVVCKREKPDGGLFIEKKLFDDKNKAVKHMLKHIKKHNSKLPSDKRPYFYDFVEVDDSILYNYEKVFTVTGQVFEQ